MSKTKVKPENKEKFEEIKNVPYPLPEGWKWIRLGEIFDIKRGSSPRPISKYLTTDKDGTNWIKIGDVKEGHKYIVKTKEKIKPEGIKKSRLVEPNDLLLSNSMSYGKAFISKIKGCIHDGWLLLRPVRGDIFIEYFYYLLNSYIIALQFKNNVQGGIVKNLNTEIVKNTIVPLPFKNGKPDLEKQKQIVEKIETIFKEIDKAITLRQKALEDTKKLFESVLNKIFKEAEEDKEGWKWYVLEDIFTDTVSGDWGKEKNMEDFKEKMYIIRGTDFKKIEINKLENIPVRYIKSTKAEKIFLKENDLIIEISGGSKDQPTGRIAIIPDVANNKRTGFSNFVRKLIFDKDIFYPKYLYYQWKFLYLHRITAKYEKASTNIRNFKYKLFLENEKIPIPIKNNQPDLEKQKQIAKYLDNLHNKIKQLEELQNKQIEKFKKLKESILNKAFRGELV